MINVQLERREHEARPLHIGITISIVVLCQLLAIGAQFTYMLTFVTQNLLLAGGAAFLMGMTPTFFLTLLVVRSPIDSKATKILVASSGGMLAVAAMLVLFWTLIEQYFMWSGAGLSSAQAIMSTIGPHIPAAFSASFFSAKFLADLFSLETYVVYVRALKKLRGAMYKLMEMERIQRSIVWLLDLADRDPEFAALYKERLNRMYQGSQKFGTLVDRIAASPPFRHSSYSDAYGSLNKIAARLLPKQRQKKQETFEDKMREVFGD